MSRAYRIEVAETLRKVIKADDHVATQLEVLEILPPEHMRELIARELKERGFAEEGDKLTRDSGDVKIEIDLATGEVVVRAEACDEIELERKRQGYVYDDVGPRRDDAEQMLREQIRRELEKQAGRKESELAQQATDALEAKLGDVRGELDQAINRVTAEALKIKAKQMGQVKRVDEDEKTGSLTIVVEV